MKVQASGSTLRREGAGTLRKASTRRLSHDAIGRRCRGACELCHRRGVELEGHHVFGRHGKYADTPELLLAICRNNPATGHQGCHERIHDGDQAKADEARYLALARFCARWNLHLEDLVAEAGPDPVDVMRAAVRRLEAGAA